MPSGSAWCELHNGEVDQKDAEQRWQDEQKALEDVSTHLPCAYDRTEFCPPVGARLKPPFR